MPAYTVLEVDPNVRDWQSQAGGPMKAYRIKLRDPEGKEIPLVEWSRKTNSPAPTVGETVEGTLESTSFGTKFKKAQTNGFGGGRPRDPKESARIIRQHSQQMALLYAGLRAEKELLPDPFSLADLKKVIDWFDADAKAALP